MNMYVGTGSKNREQPCSYFVTAIRTIRDMLHTLKIVKDTIEEHVPASAKSDHVLCSHRIANAPGVLAIRYTLDPELALKLHDALNRLKLDWAQLLLRQLSRIELIARLEEFLRPTQRTDMISAECCAQKSDQIIHRSRGRRTR